MFFLAQNIVHFENLNQQIDLACVKQLQTKKNCSIYSSANLSKPRPCLRLLLHDICIAFIAERFRTRLATSFRKSCPCEHGPNRLLHVNTFAFVGVFALLHLTATTLVLPTATGLALGLHFGLPLPLPLALPFAFF